MKEFEKLTLTIFDYVHEYAIKNLKLDYTSYPPKWTKQERDNFTQYVHMGFRKAQDLIVIEMINIEQSTQKLKKELKLAKVKKEKKKIEEIKYKINLFRHKETILRSFIDFIAWQFLNGQYYKVRRFFNSNSKDNSRPILSSSNIKSIIDVVNYYHKENPLNFALISDLTSFIDIGDILLKTNNSIIPIEVKEGKTNEEISKFINELIKKKPDVCPYSLISNPNKKFFQQTKRVLNQIDRGNKLTEFLKNEKGVDPFLNIDVHVNEKAYEIESYIDTINKMFLTLQTKNWDYQIFEDIISIGLYQKTSLPMADILLSQLNETLFGKKYPVFNYIHKLSISINEPIYYQGFSKEDLFSLLFGRRKMILSINVDNFIELCNKNNLNTRYITKKKQ